MAAMELADRKTVGPVTLIANVDEIEVNVGYRNAEVRMRRGANLDILFELLSNVRLPLKVVHEKPGRAASTHLVG